MATIDTSKIEGFDGMTAEQKLEALLKFNIPDEVDMSKLISKETFDKKCSELAQAKKDLAAKRTDEENKAIEEQQKITDLQTKYDELLKSSTIAKHTNQFLSMGYDAELAKNTAEAMFNGDMEKVFANQKTFNEAREKSLKAEWVKTDPRPNNAGNDGPEKTEAEKLAESMAKSHAEGMKASNDAISNYF